MFILQEKSQTKPNNNNRTKQALAEILLMYTELKFDIMLCVKFFGFVLFLFFGCCLCWRNARFLPNWEDKIHSFKYRAHARWPRQEVQGFSRWKAELVQKEIYP